MSDWRQKAIGSFAELRQDIDDPQTSLYDLFAGLLGGCGKRTSAATATCCGASMASLSGVSGRRRPISGILRAWDSMSVSWTTRSREAIPRWVRPEVFTRVAKLFQWRLEPADYQRSLAQYRARRGPIVLDQVPLKTPPSIDDWTI